jgi:hypothetical protein
MAKRRNRKKRPSGTGQPKMKSALPIGAQRTQIPKLAEGSSQLPKVAQRAVTLPKAAQTVGFTELEEAFFAAGDSMAERVAAKIARLRDEDDETPAARPSLWRRLFSRPAATA